jgi:hypothetical protein
MFSTVVFVSITDVTVLARDSEHFCTEKVIISIEQSEKNLFLSVADLVRYQNKKPPTATSKF